MAPNNQISFSGSFTNGLSHFKNPQAVLPTLLIEGACTAGRTHQSYKRGGALEAKERFREEVSVGIFWLWGVKGLNKLGDILGKKIFKLKDLDIDVGRDALRDPFSNVAKDIVDETTKRKVRTKTAAFKFGKIITSVVLATLLTGFIVPKVNHAITARTLKKSEEDSAQNNNVQTQNTKDKTSQGLNSLESFTQQNQKTSSVDKYLGNSCNPVFKGGINLSDWILKASYNLENNNTWRLISTDTGMIAGRIHNSRHPAEAFEYGFRDLSSIYFYNFATANAIFALNKIFKTTDIHPKAVAPTLELLKNKNFTGQDILDSLKPFNDEVVDTVKFSENNTITLQSFKEQLKSLISDPKKLEELNKKADAMSKLQPQLRGEYVLSKAQVKDVFSESISSNPKFLKDVINAATYGRANDEKKFVSMKTCQSIRESIDDYLREIGTKYCNRTLDEQLLKKIKNKTIGRTALFQATGMIISAFGLAILIPKTQIFLSQKVFGKKTFEDIANGKNQEKTENKKIG